MDDIVASAMQKWPNVPNVYGWLRLDQRGAWRIRSKSGEFERIGNPAVCEFIGRNYAGDAEGRWFFQNGPQRVFVALEYTPWVFRFADDAESLVAQNGDPSGPVISILIDEAGALIVDSELGIGVVNDRELSLLVDRLSAENPVLDGGEALMALAGSKEETPYRLFGRTVILKPVCRAAVPALFGFNPLPKAPPGEPDC